MIFIEQLKSAAADSDRVQTTLHMLNRFRERGIEYNDIISCINTGEIIEQYPNDYPHPSCLVLGTTAAGERLHAVCGTNGEYLWIISAYYPDKERWESDFKTRKERSL